VRQNAKTIIKDDYGQEHTYETTQYPAGAGWNLLLKLVKMLGKSLGVAASSVMSFDTLPQKAMEFQSSLDSEISIQKIASAFQLLAVQLIDEGGDDFVKKVLTDHTTRDGQIVTKAFDGIYQGNYGELMFAIAWVLQVNYAPFFRSRLGNVAGLVNSLRTVH
jgi:hypothetical protein